MEKAFDPSRFEDRIYKSWEEKNSFKADEKSTKPPFSIMMPPPNVTGALHNGHALFVTIQDILTRWKRMSGFNTLWLPGKDHAGIATQMVVERELSKEKKSRHELGREAFVAKVWEWKNKHGDIISTQMKKLGGGPDWSRERFTMDEGLSKTVREVFVRLHEEKLMYRGTRLINWCTRCNTALSDLEVNPVEKKGSFWHLKYVRADDSSKSLVIATTRPETLLGDTAVAVHTEDDRYKSWIGREVILPLVGKKIPIIADEYVDRTFGSGALKITPGHDFNDYDLGIKHKLPIISVFDKNGKVNENGGSYIGLSIPDAREKIVTDLTEKNLLVKTEDHVNSVGVCQRCERVVEPMISDQWFLNVKPLAEKAIKAVKAGEKCTLTEVDQRDDAIKIVPEGWVNTYYQWMENIRDWCVSRQLWWGHQIPAWYCQDCKNIMVARTTPTKCAQCSSTKLKQDEDVLDTWFSSALWPFSTLGWPEKTNLMQTFYPSSVMETGFDILFFWVARMIMMGMHFNGGKVPFKRVYLHAMVRDEKGQKMSKTKGNVIDPLEIIHNYGADAFRFTLTAMAGQGRDVKLSLERVEGYKAFCNKIWNASRYVLMRLGVVQQEGVPPTEKVDFVKITAGVNLQEWIEKNKRQFHPINQWILERFTQTSTAVNSGFENFKLNESANEVYTFVWNEYCDWYIEFSKTLLANNQTAEETQGVLLYVLESILKLAHPMIPFITEEIYAQLPVRLGAEKSKLLMLQSFPQGQFSKFSEAAEKVIIWKNAIEALRAFRGENGINPKARPSASYTAVSRHQAMISEGIPYIKALSQFENITLESSQHQQSDTVSEVTTDAVKFFVTLAGLVDVDAELKRIDKERKDTLSDLEHVRNKLAKPTFTEKAPADLIEKEKEKMIGLEKKLTEIEKNVQKLAKLRTKSS